MSLRTANRPLIGIPCWTFSPERPEFIPKHGVRRSYVDSIIAAGGCPFLIPLTTEREVLELLFAQCDGILFGGGEDISPERYGEQPTSYLRACDELRDEVEFALMRWAYRDALPTLGICRGSQLMSVCLGGTLHQDVVSSFEINHDVLRRGSRDAWEHLIHPIFIDPHSKLATILGTHEIPVNSLHHQAIRDLPQQFRAVAHSADGVIEGIEATEPNRFSVGIQSHPESLWERSEPRWLRLFEEFVEAAAQSGGREASSKPLRAA